MEEDPFTGMGPKPVIDCVIEGMEMRGVNMPSPSGPIAGYQWRLKVRWLATPQAADRIELTPWVFGSQPAVDQMLGTWQQFLTKHGHWASTAPPSAPVQ